VIDRLLALIVSMRAFFLADDSDAVQRRSGRTSTTFP